MRDASPDGPYELLRPSFDRQLAMDAFDAMPAGHHMVGLLEFDVTLALARIAASQQRGDRVSLFAFLVRAIAVAISDHPDLNLVLHGRKLVRFADVDVSVAIEVQTEAGAFPREVVLRRANQRTAMELYGEIDEARRRHSSGGAISAEDRWSRRMMRILRWVPRFLRIALIRLVVRSAFTIKRRAGTTLISSVGKFAAIPGHVFSFATGPRAAAFTIGSVVEKPWVHEGRIAIRSIVAISLLLNHDLVDGAPAARFARRLQELIETADGLADAAAVSVARA